jgi:hypothetical protein
MTSKILSFRGLLISLLSLLMVMGPASVYAATDITGVWSGTFNSNHPDVASFTIRVVITKNLDGHILGNSTLTSHCLKGANLEVTVTGSTVVLAGSDEKGDNITVRGTLDDSGTLLTSTYILNGSATGGCETDDGTGTMTKQ